MTRLLLSLLLLPAAALFAQTPAPLAPLAPDGFVTLSQIVSEFAAQPDAAAQKYNGQRILIYGRVGQVEQSDDIEGNPLVIFLQLPNQTTPDVRCIFTLADIPEWGQNATVQISEDGSQAVISHRNQQGNVNKDHVFAVVGQNQGIHGTFDRFVAGDIVLKNCKKANPEKLADILKQNAVQ